MQRSISSAKNLTAEEQAEFRESLDRIAKRIGADTGAGTASAGGTAGTGQDQGGIPQENRRAITPLSVKGKEIQFKTTPAASPPTAQQQQAQQTVSLTDESTLDAIRRKVQDDFLPVRRAQEDIAKAGGKITEQSDTYLKKDLFEGRVAERTETLKREDIDPIVKSIHDAKVDVGAE